MRPQVRKPCLVVISAFLDKRHGTERIVAEQIERLADVYDIHIYSQRVEDMDLRNVTWHHVFIPPGPHIFGYLWWLAANHICRWKDRVFHGLVPDVIYSPGVNCTDANVIAVHIVFAEFQDQIGNELDLRGNPVKSWPLLLHRRLYYRLCKFVERHAYRDDRVVLAAVSEKTGRAVVKYCGRKGAVDVVYNAVDAKRFTPARRAELRAASRAALGLPSDAFAVLLVGNDWKKKGLPYLLEAAGRLRDPKLRILIAGRDTAIPYQDAIQRLGLGSQVLFLPPRPDVEFYYAAADAYAGPSLDDSFALPPAEAMACGLAVITSRQNGGCEIIRHGVDGLILEDPCDVQTLSEWLGRLAEDASWRESLGEAAARTAAEYSWERNAAQMQGLIERARLAQSALSTSGPVTG